MMTRAAVTQSPEFLGEADRRLFCVRFGPAERRPSGAVLVVPPLFEELNKSRRVLAITARRLASHGYEVVMVDLFGTGDSGGVLEDASWDGWVDDLHLVRERLVGRTGGVPMHWLAVRAGSLLLPALLTRPGENPESVVTWNPVVDGRQYLLQVLRLRAMASRFEGREETVKELDAALHSGSSVEVGGYEITPELAAALREATFGADADPAPARFVALECRQGGGTDVAAPLRKVEEGLRSRKAEAHARLVACEQFWASQEIAAPAALVDATLAALP